MNGRSPAIPRAPEEVADVLIDIFDEEDRANFTSAGWAAMEALSLKGGTAIFQKGLRRERDAYEWYSLIHEEGPEGFHALHEYLEENVGKPWDEIAIRDALKRLCPIFPIC